MATTRCWEAGRLLAGEMAGSQVLKTLGWGAWLLTLLGAHLSLTSFSSRVHSLGVCICVSG